MCGKWRVHFKTAFHVFNRSILIQKHSNLEQKLSIMKLANNHDTTDDSSVQTSLIFLSFLILKYEIVVPKDIRHNPLINIGCRCICTGNSKQIQFSFLFRMRSDFKNHKSYKGHSTIIEFLWPLWFFCTIYDLSSTFCMRTCFLMHYKVRWMQRITNWWEK